MGVRCIFFLEMEYGGLIVEWLKEGNTSCKEGKLSPTPFYTYINPRAGTQLLESILEWHGYNSAYCTANLAHVKSFITSSLEQKSVD